MRRGREGGEGAERTEERREREGETREGVGKGRMGQKWGEARDTREGGGARPGRQRDRSDARELEQPQDPAPLPAWSCSGETGPPSIC